jgi:hypothetical protein
MAGSGLIDEIPIHALNDRQANQKIMPWALGARPSVAKLINYVLYD